MRFFTPDKISPRKSLTPEGFLLCEGAPLARTGMQIYGPGETPVTTGKDGIVRIERKPEEVFRAETVASFSGKPVVDNHPQDEKGQRIDVNPHNWKQLAVGVVMHPRRGEGLMDDILIGDLLITDRDAIRAIQDGKRELSCGYDADYFEVEPGRGEQRNIIGNHVALVESGRCGPRCAIGDHEEGRSSMKISDRLRQAFAGRDEKAFTDAMSEIDKEPTLGAPSIHVHTGVSDKATMDAAIDARFKALEDGQQGILGVLKKVQDKLTADEESEEEKKKKEEEAKKAAEAKEGEAAKTGDASFADLLAAEMPTGTDVSKVRDSGLLADAFKNTVALAEVMAPGIELPTYDPNAKPLKTYEGICKLRAKALDAAYADADTKALIDQVVGAGKTFDTARMPCGDIRVLFHTIGAVRKTANNSSRHTAADIGTGGGMGVKGLFKTPAELNAHNRKAFGA